MFTKTWQNCVKNVQKYLLGNNITATTAENKFLKYNLKVF